MTLIDQIKLQKMYDEQAFKQKEGEEKKEVSLEEFESVKKQLSRAKKQLSNKEGN